MLLHMLLKTTLRAQTYQGLASELVLFRCCGGVVSESISATAALEMASISIEALPEVTSVSRVLRIT